MEEYLSTRQIAERLHINIITVRRWIEKGKLPAYQIGRDYRVKKSDFEKLMEKRRVNK